MRSIATQSLPVLAAAGIVLLAVACAPEQPVQEVEDQLAESTLAASPSVVDDAAIAREVETKLTGDPELGAFAIDVEVDRGVVVLRGDVTTVEEQAQAEALALNTHGVSEVVNQIQVADAGGPTDPTSEPS